MIKNRFREALYYGPSVLTERLVLKDYNLYVQLVADAYDKLVDYDSSVISHWAALNQSNHVLFKRLLSKVNVVFVTNEPSAGGGSILIDGRKFPIEHISFGDEYKTQSEMKRSFMDTGILKISIDYSNHKIFSVVDNIVFRTVHDYIAHILGDYDFGARGEIACYNLHAKMASSAAIPALFTEVVGQASVTLVSGKFPVQKIALMNGFDYINVGVVDDDRYEIRNKSLVLKGGDVSLNKSDRTEPTAVHS